MIRLITDTSANLPVSLIQKYNITVLSFHLTVDGVPFPYNYKTDFDGKSYYDKMRGGARVQTSMINQSDYGDAFTDAVANGDDVLYVGMSGGISGAARIAQIAANEVLADYPDRQIEVIDTYAASLGEGLQVLAAAEMLASGMSLSEAADKLRADRAHMCQYFTVRICSAADAFRVPRRLWGRFCRSSRCLSGMRRGTLWFRTRYAGASSL